MTDTCTCHWQPARIGQPMDADLDPACPIHGAAVVSSSPDIPDEAVEAFLVAYYGRPHDHENAKPLVRKALVAAYPALTRQAVEVIEAFVIENHGDEHPEGTCEVCDLFGSVPDLIARVGGTDE